MSFFSFHVLIGKIQLKIHPFNVDISRISTFRWIFPTQGTAAAGITLGALGAAVLRANRAKTVIPTKAFENELGPIGMSDGWLIIVRNRKKSSYMVY